MGEEPCACDALCAAGAQQAPLSDVAHLDRLLLVSQEVKELACTVRERLIGHLRFSVDAGNNGW